MTLKKGMTENIWLFFFNIDFYEPCKVELDPHCFPIFFVLVSPNTDAAAEQIMRARVRGLLPLPGSRAAKGKKNTAQCVCPCVYVCLRVPTTCVCGGEM